MEGILHNLTQYTLRFNESISTFNDRSEKYTNSILFLTRVMLIVAVVNAALVGYQIFLMHNPPSAAQATSPLGEDQLGR